MSDKKYTFMHECANSSQLREDMYNFLYPPPGKKWLFYIASFKHTCINNIFKIITRHLHVQSQLLYCLWST